MGWQDLPIAGQEAQAPASWQGMPAAPVENAANQTQVSASQPGLFETNQIARNLTFGLSDKAAALGAGVGAVLPGSAHPGNFWDSYGKRLDQLRQEASSYSQAHPVASVLGPIAGGLISAPAAAGSAALTLPQSIGQAAKAGGLIGAAQGFAGAEDTPAAAIKDTALGAAGGAAIGAMVPPALQLVRPMAEGFQRLMPSYFPGAVERQAQARIGERVAQDVAAGGPGAIEMLSALQQAPGKPQALVDVAGENVRGLAGSLARTPGTSREIAQNLFRTRDVDAGARLIGDIDHSISSGSNAHEAVQNLIQQRAGAAAPLYQKAYEAPVSTSPRLEQFLKDPDVKRGLANGMEIQRREALASGQPGAAIPPAAVPGAPASVEAEPRRPMDIMQFLMSQGGIKDQGGELAAMDLHQVNKGYFGRLARSNGMPLDTAREKAVEAGYLHPDSDINDLLNALYNNTHGAPVFNPSEPETIAWQEFQRRDPFDIPFGEAVPAPRASLVDPGTPDLRTLDMAKAGLDDMIEQSRDPTSGRLQLDRAGRALNDVRHSFVNELDRLYPDYAAARQAYSGPSASMDAIRRGQGFQSLRPEEIKQQVGRMPDNERDFFLLGVADKLRSDVLKTATNGDEAKRLINSQYVQNQLTPLFHKQDDYDRFINSVMAERRMFETRGAVVGNSATAGRMAEDVGNAPGGSLANLVAGGAGILAHEPFAAAPLIMRGLKAGYDALGRPNAALREAMAKALFSPNQNLNELFLNQLAQRKLPPQVSPLLINPAARAAGTLLPGWSNAGSAQ